MRYVNELVGQVVVGDKVEIVITSPDRWLAELRGIVANVGIEGAVVIELLVSALGLVALALALALVGFETASEEPGLLAGVAASEFFGAGVPAVEGEPSLGEFEAPLEGEAEGLTSLGEAAPEAGSVPGAD